MKELRRKQVHRNNNKQSDLVEALLMVYPINDLQRIIFAGGHMFIDEHKCGTVKLSNGNYFSFQRKNDLVVFAGITSEPVTLPIAHAKRFMANLYRYIKTDFMEFDVRDKCISNMNTALSYAKK